jgi:hypothetical protein
MSDFHVNAYFTDGDMWALVHALDVLSEETYLTEEQWEFAQSAREKLLNSVE